MAIFDRLRGKKETREVPAIAGAKVRASHALTQLFAFSGGDYGAGVAMQVPAIWNAIHFLSGTLASLPIRVLELQPNGLYKPVDTQDAEQRRLNGFVDEATSTYAWRYHLFARGVFSYGRGITYIDRDNNEPTLVMVDPSRVTVLREQGQTIYRVYQEGSGTLDLLPEDVIDIVWDICSDGLHVTRPWDKFSSIVALGAALVDFQLRSFTTGGIPPFIFRGMFETADAAAAAIDDLLGLMEGAAGTPMIAIDNQYEVIPMAVDHDKLALTESQNLLTLQVARIFSIPPAYLQDLTRSTYSNIEHQGRQLVSTTLMPWITQMEIEMSEKLWPEGNRRVDFDVDYLQRGDFATRVQGQSQLINAGIRTINEVREREGLEKVEGGDETILNGNFTTLEKVTKEPEPVPAALQGLPPGQPGEEPEGDTIKGQEGAEDGEDQAEE